MGEHTMRREDILRTLPQHFVKCQYVPLMYLGACRAALADPGRGISYMTCTLALSTLMSEGVAQ